MRFLFCLLATAALLPGANELSGRRAPGFSLPDLHLEQRDLQDYRGKIVVLEIIQTKCPHCAAFSEILAKAKVKYGDRLAVLAIVNPPDNQTTVAEFSTAHKITTPILFDCGQVAMSYLKATPQKPTVDVPHVFVIDGEGMIRNDYGYEFDTHSIFEGEGLNAVIDGLLAAKTPANAKVH